MQMTAADDRIPLINQLKPSICSELTGKGKHEPTGREIRYAGAAPAAKMVLAASDVACEFPGSLAAQDAINKGKYGGG
jgi:hypothetical protein